MTATVVHLPSMLRVISAPPLTDIELCAWISQADAGEQLEYHRGYLAVDRRYVPTGPRSASECSRIDALAARALEAAERGLIHLLQLRLDLNRYSYLAVARPRTSKSNEPSAILGLLFREAA